MTEESLSTSDSIDARALEPVVAALVGTAVHDLGVLLLALVPLVGIANRLGRSLDPIAGLVTDEFTSDPGDDADETDDPGTGSSGAA